MAQEVDLGELPLQRKLDDYRPVKLLYGKAKDTLPSWSVDKKRKLVFDEIVANDKKQGYLSPNTYFKTEGKEQINNKLMV